MRPIRGRHHAARERRIGRRLGKPVTAPSPASVSTAADIHEDIADRFRIISRGGIGAIPLGPAEIEAAMWMSRFGPAP